MTKPIGKERKKFDGLEKVKNLYTVYMYKPFVTKCVWMQMTHVTVVVQMKY